MWPFVLVVLVGTEALQSPFHSFPDFSSNFKNLDYGSDPFEHGKPRKKSDEDFFDLPPLSLKTWNSDFGPSFHRKKDKYKSPGIKTGEERDFQSSLFGATPSSFKILDVDSDGPLHFTSSKTWNSISSPPRKYEYKRFGTGSVSSSHSGSFGVVRIQDGKVTSDFKELPPVQHNAGYTCKSSGELRKKRDTGVIGGLLGGLVNEELPQSASIFNAPVNPHSERILNIPLASKDGDGGGLLNLGLNAEPDLLGGVLGKPQSEKTLNAPLVSKDGDDGGLLNLGLNVKSDLLGGILGKPHSEKTLNVPPVSKDGNGDGLKINLDLKTGLDLGRLLEIPLLKSPTSSGGKASASRDNKQIIIADESKKEDGAIYYDSDQPKKHAGLASSHNQDLQYTQSRKYSHSEEGQVKELSRVDSDHHSYQETLASLKDKGFTLSKNIQQQEIHDEYLESLEREGVTVPEHMKKKEISLQNTKVQQIQAEDEQYKVTKESQHASSKESLFKEQQAAMRSSERSSSFSRQQAVNARNKILKSEREQYFDDQKEVTTSGKSQKHDTFLQNTKSRQIQARDEIQRGSKASLNLSSKEGHFKQQQSTMRSSERSSFTRHQAIINKDSIEKITKSGEEQTAHFNNLKYASLYDKSQKEESFRQNSKGHRIQAQDEQFRHTVESSYASSRDSQLEKQREVMISPDNPSSFARQRVVNAPRKIIIPGETQRTYFDDKKNIKSFSNERRIHLGSSREIQNKELNTTSKYWNNAQHIDEKDYFRKRPLASQILPIAKTSSGKSKALVSILFSGNPNPEIFTIDFDQILIPSIQRGSIVYINLSEYLSSCSRYLPLKINDQAVLNSPEHVGLKTESFGDNIGQSVKRYERGTSNSWLHEPKGNGKNVFLTVMH